MQLQNITPPEFENMETHYSVESISEDDIGAHTSRFLRVIRGIDSLKMINSLTADQFTTQIRKRFSTREV